MRRAMIGFVAAAMLSVVGMARTGAGGPDGMEIRAG